MRHILRCSIALLDRIVRLDPDDKEQNYMKRYEPESQPARPKLIASHVDIPAVAGSCNPTLLVAPALREKLESIAAIFPHRPIGVGSVSISKHDHDEYLLFTAAIVKAGKVNLRLRPSGVASFFVVGKPGRDRLRPIWSGDKVSEACVAPPKPRRLGNPASFVDILVRPGEMLYYSKRDAETYFDTLEAPADARKWFCYPPITAARMCATLGCTLDHLANLVVDGDRDMLADATLLYPSSVTWPMGFAWSSCVAQDTTVSVLTSTGFDESCIICDSEPLPACQRELAIVATDDVVFVHRDRDEAIARVLSFVAALEHNNIPRAVHKDDRVQGNHRSWMRAHCRPAMRARGLQEAVARVECNP